MPSISTTTITSSNLRWWCPLPYLTPAPWISLERVAASSFPLLLNKYFFLCTVIFKFFHLSFIFKIIGSVCSSINKHKFSAKSCVWSTPFSWQERKRLPPLLTGVTVTSAWWYHLCLQRRPRRCSQSTRSSRFLQERSTSAWLLSPTDLSGLTVMEDWCTCELYCFIRTFSSL